MKFRRTKQSPQLYVEARRGSCLVPELVEGKEGKQWGKGRRKWKGKAREKKGDGWERRSKEKKKEERAISLLPHAPLFY